VDAVGKLRVHSDVAFDDRVYDLQVVEGVNVMDGHEATGFARSRKYLLNDFERQANQQRLLEAILDQLGKHQDDEGFLEAGALAALQHLDTNLSPVELYRFAQAVSLIDLEKAETCIIGGTDDTIDGDAVIHLDEAEARRVAGDAADDAQLAGGCS
jgi:anionic cell wall polymer biosynthesis LytR-Cps2A-Psr (LCP) family protein